MPLKREPNVRFSRKELDDWKQANRTNAETILFLSEKRNDERSTLLVFANQYLALQRWIEHTVPQWTQEVQCCMDDCERTANRIIDYLDGKIECLNPRKADALLSRETKET